MGIFLLILISALVFLTTFVTTNGVMDKRRKLLKRITEKGWKNICLYIVIIGLSIFQYKYNENTIEEKELKAKKEAKSQYDSSLHLVQKKSDSSLIVMKSKFDSSFQSSKASFDSSNYNVMSIISENLGKYGFALDSTTKKMENIAKADPVFQLESVDLKDTIGDMVRYGLFFKSNDAGSTDLNINIKILFTDDLLLSNIYFRYYFNLDKNSRISINNGFIKYIEINKFINFKYIILYINGEYKNLDKSKIFQIDDLHHYNTLSKSTYNIVGKTKSNILSFLNN